MAGKKGRSGRPFKHGAYITQNNDPELRAYLRTHEKAMIDQKGGIDNITPLQQIQIQNALRILHKLFFMDKYIARKDVIVNGEVLPVLRSSYLAYINSLSRILRSLDLEDTSKNNTGNLEAYIKAKQSQKEKNHDT